MCTMFMFILFENPLDVDEVDEIHVLHSIYQIIKWRKKKETNSNSKQIQLTGKVHILFYRFISIGHSHGHFQFCVVTSLKMKKKRSWARF